MTAWNLQDVMLQIQNQKAPFTPVVPASGAPMLIDGVAKIKDGPSPAGRRRLPVLPHGPGRADQAVRDVLPDPDDLTAQGTGLAG